MKYYLLIIFFCILIFYFINKKIIIENFEDDDKDHYEFIKHIKENNYKIDESGFHSIFKLSIKSNNDDFIRCVIKIGQNSGINKKIF